ncbi:MAG: hypothetical protein NZ901_00310 [Geminocystis sp.]|nr:hypothetical protein [Geminocystis sp.]HIK37587.1 hypothetical protein [Geminocystis sp. M7585_C2015_104]MCS7146610.1 hypothetical protein [Geminocystis sp.]MCX8077491.1 hypothetical protein [Geminocystis sp.]MDW8115436.1 hypothetical protein [Geminocystis sp.]
MDETARGVFYDKITANLQLKAMMSIIYFPNHTQATSLMALHDLELVLELFNRALVMNQGKIVAEGILENVMTDKGRMTANNPEIL